MSKVAYSFPATLFVFGLLLSGCKSGADLEAPQMEVIRFDPAPRQGMVCGEPSEEVFFVASGESLNFEVLFTDNDELSEYKIDIHSNFDCHGHARKTEDWSVLEIGELDGNAHSLSHSIRVPDDVTAGAYHFQIQVTDKSGNDNPFANYYAIVVTNKKDTVPPVLSLTAPAAASFSVQRGTELRFSGTLTDNYSLGEGGNGKLLLTYNQGTGGNVFTAVEQNFPETEGTSRNFDFGFTVPNTLVVGTYTFVLSGYDGVNNESTRARFTVEVTR
jgi:hypothetical protein